MRLLNEILNTFSSVSVIERLQCILVGVADIGLPVACGGFCSGFGRCRKFSGFIEFCSRIG